MTTSRPLLSGEGGGLEVGHLAALLAGHVLGRPRAWVLAHPEEPLSDEQHDQLNRLAHRLQAGEPLPYLLGHWEFYGLDFIVSPDVLIPRPETELMVELALAWLRKYPMRRRAADVGTGSGCIAVSLAKQTPDLRILAVDRSPAALDIARQNALRHQVSGQISFEPGDLLTGVIRPFDLICANLPYIPRAALDGLDVARYEPHLALDGGADGLAAICALLSDAPRWFSPGGLMLLEMQYDQGEAVMGLTRAALPAARVTVRPDLAGLPRLVEIENEE